MTVAKVLENYLDLTLDAVCVGYRGPGATEPLLVFANPAHLRLFGYDSKDLIGQPVRLILDPDHFAEYAAQVDALLQSSQTSFNVETSCRKSDGTTFSASISYFVCQDEEIGAQYTCATIRDISDLKVREEKAEMALRERDDLIEEKDRVFDELFATQDRLINAINAYPDPFVIYDKDLRLVISNSAHKRSFSSDEDAIQPGMHLRDVLHEAKRTGKLSSFGGDPDDLIEFLLGEDAVSENVSIWSFDDGRYQKVFRVQAENGDRVVIRMDITELVRQKRSAEEAQERLLAAIRAYPSPFSLYDSDLRILVWNDSYAGTLTNSPDPIQVGMSLEDVLRIGIRSGGLALNGDTEDEYLAKARLAVTDLRPAEDIELAGDRHHRLLRSRTSIGDYVFLRIDMTELVRQRRDLEVTQNRLISAINAFPDPFAIYARDLSLQIWNPAFTASITDRPEEVVRGMDIRDVVTMAVRNGRLKTEGEKVEECLRGYSPAEITLIESEEVEWADDKYCRIIRTLSEQGELVVLRFDITAEVLQRQKLEDYARRMEEANQEILYKALHDQLTGLGNRRYLMQKFDELSERRAQVGGELAALHIDLDRFKQINDTMGHAAGDHVLLEVAERIRDKVETDDVVARIGGDEFVVLIWLPEGSNRAEDLAQALLADLTAPTCYEGRECRFGASIGVARTPLADEDQLLTNSDVALYKAKRHGRGRIGIFDRTDVEEMRETKERADDLFRGLEAEEFIPFFQPQIDAKTGRFVGLEALARWQHPTKGILAPDHFIGVATDLSVVADIDRMIFESALVECQETFGDWLEPPSVSFNVSARRIDFEQIAEIGELASTYSGVVAIELLETIFMEEESNDFLLQLDQLREMGISIEVDDFGSGRASVVALQRIAPDKLKIDRRLVAPMAAGNNATRLVQSIVEIGHALDISVVAEGVETAEQAQLLANLGVERLQGFYFSRPRALHELQQHLLHINQLLKAS
ncbi:MAG: EAL domain-containing protein [Pseudomonadota bacterium]